LLYAIAIDERTDVKDFFFVRGVNENFPSAGKIFEMVAMKGKTGTNEILSQLVTILKKFELLLGRYYWVC
jgi:hypothetical protein